jgi:hypothetical protein
MAAPIIAEKINKSKENVLPRNSNIPCLKVEISKAPSVYPITSASSKSIEQLKSILVDDTPVVEEDIIVRGDTKLAIQMAEEERRRRLAYWNYTFSEPQKETIMAVALAEGERMRRMQFMGSSMFSFTSRETSLAVSQAEEERIRRLSLFSPSFSKATNDSNLNIVELVEAERSRRISEGKSSAPNPFFNSQKCQVVIAPLVLDVLEIEEELKPTQTFLEKYFSCFNCSKKL